MRTFSLFSAAAAVIVAVAPVVAQSTGAMSGRQATPAPGSTSQNRAMSGNDADNGMMSNTMVSPSSKGMAATKPMSKKSMHHKKMPAKKSSSSSMTPNDR